MANEWRTVKLGKLCSKIGSGATPRGGSKVYLEHGPFALVRSQNIRNDSFTCDGLAYITAEQADGLANVELQPKDVLLNITGDSVARCCLVDEGILPGRVNQHVAIIRPRADELDPVFLRYFLISPKMQEKMLSWAAAGGTRSALTKGMIEAFEVPCPQISTQRAIAHILGTLDDKIECNRRLNRTLEGIVRALFKSWFIDFDPVIDNALAAGNPIPDELSGCAALRQQAATEYAKPLPDDLRALFPAEFTHTDTMGWIPKGWETGRLDDMLILQRGFDLPKARRTDGAFSLIAASGPDGTHQEAKVPGPGVVTGRSGKLGIVTFVQDAFWPLNTTLWVKEYRRSSPYHAYLLLETLGLDRFNAGSAVPTLNRNHIHGMRLQIPPKAVVDKFSSVARVFFDRCAANTKTSTQTADLRDSLLPKLLTGEVTVSLAAMPIEEDGDGGARRQLQISARHHFDLGWKDKGE